MGTNIITTYERLERQRILPSSDIKPHEFLFTWHDIPCFARGELVAMTGKAKSGKTYFNSILMAEGLVTEVASTGQRTGLGIKRIRDEPLKVLWIDTEQSEDSTHEILRDRIGTMIGEEPHPEQFMAYNMRQVNWQEREELVEAAILYHMPDLVIFDGIRDVVGDINDYAEAQTIIGKLLSIASFSHACIVCVLHQNKAVEDKTLRGALGTELQNKSFETYECAKDPDTRIFTVRQVATRKYDLPNKQQFALSPEGLPIACYTPEEDEKTAVKERPPFNPIYVAEGKIDKPKLFNAVLEGRNMTWTELKESIMETATICSGRFAEMLITEARDAGIITSIPCDDGRRRYTIVRETLFDETS